MDHTEDLDAVLQRAFDESTKIYKKRGFQRRIGFGKKPDMKAKQRQPSCWPSGPAHQSAHVSIEVTIP